METSLYRRRTSNFDLCSELLSTEQWGFFSVLHYCATFIIVIFGDQWHLHLLPSVWQWSWHNLFFRPMSVAAGICTPNLTRTRRTLYPTVPPRLYMGFKVLDVIKIIQKQHIKKKHTQKGNKDINHFTYLQIEGWIDLEKKYFIIIM